MNETAMIECVVKDGKKEAYLKWFEQEKTALQPESCISQDGLPAITVGFKNRNTRQLTVGKFVRAFPDAEVDWR